MAKHRAGGAPRLPRPAWVALALAGLLLAGVLVVLNRSGTGDSDSPGGTGVAAGPSCDRPLRVVAASSYGCRRTTACGQR
jgi:hypothetical protein